MPSGHDVLNPLPRINAYHILKARSSHLNTFRKSCKQYTRHVAFKDYLGPAISPDLMSIEQWDDPVFGASSRAVSLVDLPAGALLTTMSAATPAAQRTYLTVQADSDKQISLNSDLNFCNHSCDPSLVFDLSRREVRVDTARALRKGDELTFFYPSSEVEMAEPFDCRCGASTSSERPCLGTIAGAQVLEPEILSNYWLNAHVRQMVQNKSGHLNGIAKHSATSVPVSNGY